MNTDRDKKAGYVTPEMKVFKTHVERGVYSSGLPDPGDDSGFEWG